MKYFLKDVKMLTACIVEHGYDEVLLVVLKELMPNI